MALSIQCLVSGLESETLSQNQAWSWNGVLEREQQASQALWDPWINVIPDDRVTRWEREGEGRVHASDLDRGVRWCLEREHKSRQGAVCWALEPSGMLGGAKCRDRPPPHVSCREASDVAPEFLPTVPSLPCLHLWPGGGQKAGRWSQVVGWISCRLHCSLDGLISHL